MDILSWSIIAASLLIGCWIQTALGFGLAVFAAPIIVSLKPEWVPVLITIVALIISVLNTYNQREDIELKELNIAFITRVPGTLAGVYLLSLLSEVWLQLAVALCVLLAVVISYFGKQFDYTPARMGWAAFVSGITGTTTSIGGPPMALVMQHGKATTVRANLSLYFSYSCILSLVGYAWMGLINTEILSAAALFTPICLLGFLSGIRARGYVDAGRFRPLLLILCSVAGGFAMLGAINKLIA